MNTPEYIESVKASSEYKQREALRQYEQFVADLAAFIRFAQRNSKSDTWTLGNIAHDINGVHYEGLDGCFSPRVTGYAASESSREQAENSFIE